MLSTAIDEALVEERRSARMVLRLTPGDAALLQARAAAAGIDRASCARALIRAGLAAQPELVAA